MNNAAKDICVQVFVWTYLSVLLGIYVGVGIAGSSGYLQFSY